MTPVAKSRLLIVIGAAGLLLFFLHLLGALSGVETRFVKFLSPHESRLAEAARSLRQGIRNPFRVNKIIAENESLKNERNAILVEVAGLRAIEEENSSLRELLAFAKRREKPPIVAHVLARSPEAGTHTITIDRGADDGLMVDMPVIVGGGIVVGKIFKLERATSIALLLTDTRSRIGASTHNAAKTQGIVQGKRGLSLEMRLIPQNEEILRDDLVVTSGIEPMVPRGLVIGHIEAIESQERDPFKTASIVSPVAYDDLDIVAVPVP
jgi:rod shape-determining protein MreC